MGIRFKRCENGSVSWVSFKQGENQMKKKQIVMLVGVLVSLIVVVAAVLFFTSKPPEARAVQVLNQSDELIETIFVTDGTKVQLLDKQKDVVQEFTIAKDQKALNVPATTDENDPLFVAYELSQYTDESTQQMVYQVTPVFESKKDFLVTASSSKGATLRKYGKLKESVVISVDKNDKLIEVLPEVVLEDGHKGNWHYKASNTPITADDTATADATVIFIAFQDFNDNHIDDLTESFGVTFDSGVVQQVEPKTVKWGEKINLPQVRDPEYIFFGWFTDEARTKPFTEEMPVTDTLHLYAKIVPVAQVMTQSVEHPITDRTVAKQLEDILSERNRQADIAYNETILAENAQRAAREEEERQNNVSVSRNYSVTYANTALNKLYFVSFIDEYNQFLFGMVAPYGRAIKIYNESDILWKEFAVRQHTTIMLDSEALVAHTKDLIGYNSDYYRFNDILYVRISPKTNN